MYIIGYLQHDRETREGNNKWHAYDGVVLTICNDIKHTGEYIVMIQQKHIVNGGILKTVMYFKTDT